VVKRGDKMNESKSSISQDKIKDYLMLYNNGLSQIKDELRKIPKKLEQMDRLLSDCDFTGFIIEIGYVEKIAFSLWKEASDLRDLKDNFLSYCVCCQKKTEKINNRGYCFYCEEAYKDLLKESL